MYFSLVSILCGTIEWSVFFSSFQTYKKRLIKVKKKMTPIIQLKLFSITLMEEVLLKNLSQHTILPTLFFKTRLLTQLQPW